MEAERTYGRVEHVEKLARGMEGDEKGWYQGMGRPNGKGTEMFDVLVVCKGKKETFVHTDLPEVFRPHWSKYVSFSSRSSPSLITPCTTTFLSFPFLFLPWGI